MLVPRAFLCSAVTVHQVKRRMASMRRVALKGSVALHLDCCQQGLVETTRDQLASHAILFPLLAHWRVVPRYAA